MRDSSQLAGSISDVGNGDGDPGGDIFRTTAGRTRFSPPHLSADVDHVYVEIRD